MTDDLTQLRADAPERIGLIRSPFGWRFWTREEDGGLPADVEYVRADELDALRAERDEARARVTALEKGLEPFAAYIKARDEDDADIPDETAEISYATSLRVPVVRVTMGDFRHAGALLNPKEGIAE